MLSYTKINKSLEITRRISTSEEEKINTQLEKLPNIRENIANIQVAVDTPRWKNIFVIHDENMPLYALLAYQNKQIKKKSFVTFLLYWAIRQCHKNKLLEIQMHFLFDPKKGEMSRHILRESVLYRPRDVAHKAFYFTDQMFEDFIEEVRKLPISEQHFFLVPFTESSIADILESRFVGFRVFGTVNNQYMVASFGMMQTYLNILYGSSAIKMNPVIGYSSLLDIRKNGLTNRRDFAAHFKSVYLPLEADGHFAPWYIFSKHDFYHAAIISNIPIEHRYLFIRLSDAIIKDFGDENNLKEFFSNYFIDMEGSSYVTEDYKTIEDKFWGFLQGAIYLYTHKNHAQASSMLYQDVFFRLFEVLINEKENASSIIAVVDSGFSNIKKTMSDTNVLKSLHLIKEIWDVYKEQLNHSQKSQHDSPRFR